MSQTYCILLEINEGSLQWAKTYYSQFWEPHLGNKKRTSYLLSRALLLHTLEKYYQIKQLPEIIYNQHQKPIFKSSDITFNLTHSTDFVGLVISSESCALGIDIESIMPRRNFLGLLQRTFEPQEICWILKTTKTQFANIIQAQQPLTLKEDEMVRFFLLWSAKEAYLKADGRGLQGLNTLHLSPQLSTMDGDLENGSLLLTTLAATSTNHLSSLALYLPNQLLPKLSIQTLAITNHYQTINHPLSINWHYHLIENNRSLL